MMGKIGRVLLPLLIFIIASQGNAAVAEGPSFFQGEPGRFLPGSPLYLLDMLWGKIRVWFTLNPGDKARVYTRLAEERLAEVKVLLVDQGTKHGVERALSDYQEHLTSLAHLLESIEGATPIVEEGIFEALNEQKNEFARLREQLPEDIEYVLSPAEGALQEQLSRFRR